MPTFRSFTDLDWMGYGGAEPFPDGQAPLISADELLIDGEAADIILDANGVSIFWTLDCEVFNALADANHAPRVVAMLRPAMTYAELAALPGVRIERC